MSVVVRMEMPENCTCCPMCFTADVQGYHWCAALEQEVEEGLSRSKECPIICSLPEGHGRLIDASTIIGEVDAGYTDDYGNLIPVNRPVSVDEYLGLEVPTIVPAERSET